MITDCSFIYAKSAKKTSKDQISKNINRLLLFAKKKRLNLVTIEKESDLKILKKITHWVVFGDDLEDLIGPTVEALLKKKHKIWIPVDAVRSNNETNREMMMKHLRAKGAEMWNTDFIIKSMLNGNL